MPEVHRMGRQSCSVLGCGAVRSGWVPRSEYLRPFKSQQGFPVLFLDWSLLFLKGKAGGQLEEGSGRPLDSSSQFQTPRNASSNTHHCRLTHSYFILVLGTPRKSHFCKSDFCTSPNPFCGFGAGQKECGVKLGRCGVSGWLALGPTWAACAGVSACGPSNPSRAARPPRRSTNQANSSLRPPELSGARLGRLQAHNFQHLTGWSPNLPF